MQTHKPFVCFWSADEGTLQFPPDGVMGRVQILTEMLIELINPLLFHSHQQHAGTHFHPTSPSLSAGFCGIMGELRARISRVGGWSCPDLLCLGLLLT